MKAERPEIVEMRQRTVLSVTTVGDPGETAARSIEALYGTAYSTKFKTFKPRGVKMEIGRLACRWPDAHLKPKSEWTGIWGLEVSDFVRDEDLAQKIPDIPVSLARWEGGAVAQVLYKGPYSGEGPIIEALHRFIEESGYRLAGPHEEEYLTKPDVAVPKTIIRYRIAPA